MKNLRFLLLLTALLVSWIPNLVSGDYEIEQVKKKLPKMLGANNVGKDFWFTIPPCYEDESGSEDNFIKVYVTTPAKTIVTLEIPGKGYSIQKTSIPNDVIEFNVTPVAGCPWTKTGSVRPPEEKIWKGAGIHVYADYPLVVYGVVRYQYTSDGFLAYPTSSLGKEYYSASYGSMDALTGGRYFPSLTGCVAAYDNTNIKFTVGGNSYTRTTGGLKTGASESYNLSKGDVIMFASDGAAQDLTGSHYIGNKPFGVMSGNYCTNIPIDNPWCDYTVEMDMPVFTWGTVYNVPKVCNRKYPSLIRVFAKEKGGTTVYRDGSPIITLADNSGKQNKSWMEFRLVSMNESPASAVISSEKPISITLYNTGVAEDGPPTPNSDPFIEAQTPIEQYQKEITFCCPGVTGGLKFNENYLNLVYETDSNNNTPDDLEFAQVFNGEYYWEKVKYKFSGSDELFKQKTSGKQYAVKNITLPAVGVFKIRAAKPFAAYSYGYAHCDSYGFPTSAALMDIERPDTACPIPDFHINCDGSVKDGTVKDMPDDGEIRTNLAMIVYDSELSYNYEFRYDDFIPGSDRSTSWTLSVRDPSEDAKAVITFSDRRGNDTTIIIEYTAMKVTIEPDILDWGLLKTGEKAELPFTVRNSSDKPVIIMRLELKTGSTANFSLIGVTLPFTIEGNSTREFKAAFTAAKEGDYSDSLGIGDTCVFTYRVPLYGKAGNPVIYTGSLDFGKVTVGETFPKEFSIENRGTTDLKITAYSGPDDDKTYIPDPTLHSDISAADPLVVVPKGKSVNYTIKFRPQQIGTFTDRIVFSSNANTIDSILEITGIGIEPGLVANSYNWGRVRIDRPDHRMGPYPNTWIPGQDRAIMLRNNGTEAVTISKANINAVKGDVGAFHFKNNGEADFIRTLQPGESYLVEVEFQPQSVGEHEIEITYLSNAESPVTTLKGIGILPKGHTENTDFGLTLIDDETQRQEHTVRFTNDIYEWQDTMAITGFTMDNGRISEIMTTYGTEGFRFDKATEMGKTTASDAATDRIILAPGESIDISAQFVARHEGTNTATLVTVSDAESEMSSVLTGEGRSQNIDGPDVSLSECVTNPEDERDFYTVPISVSNDATADVKVDSVIIENKPGVFCADDPNLEALGFALKAGDTKIYNIRFKPLVEGTYETNVLFYNNTKNKNPMTVHVNATGEYYTRDCYMEPKTRVINIGEEHTVGVHIKAGDDLSPASLTNITAEVYYENDFLKPGKIELGAALPSDDYTMDAPVVTEESGNGQGRISVKIAAKGNANFNIDGEILRITFKSYLPAFAKPVAQLTDTIKTEDNDCAGIITTGGCTIEVNPVCSGSLISVRRLFGTNSINIIKPNPAGADGANIEFTTALEAWTELRVFNSNGELVMIPVSTILKPGEHSFRLETKDLPSGTYTLRMTTGDYSQTRNFNVVK